MTLAPGAAQAAAIIRSARCRLCDAELPDGEHDPCIAGLPGVAAACCGHGERWGYVRFSDGRTIRGYFDHVERPVWAPTLYGEASAPQTERSLLFALDFADRLARDCGVDFATGFRQFLNAGPVIALLKIDFGATLRAKRPVLRDEPSEQFLDAVRPLWAFDKERYEFLGDHLKPSVGRVATPTIGAGGEAVMASPSPKDGA